MYFNSYKHIINLLNDKLKVKCIRKLVRKSSTMKKSRSLMLPIDIQIELFNKTIKPILLYGCEVWGFDDLSVIEQVQLKFLKFILNIKKSTPNCIVYGETGVLPLKIDIHTRMVSYWAKLIQPETDNLSSKLYWIAKDAFENRNASYFKWFTNVHNIFIHCGYSGIWDNPGFPSKIWLTKSIKQRLTDLYIQEWSNECDTQTSCYFYKIIKPTFGFENYLIKIPFKLRRYLINIRTRNHRLPVETGRWRRASRQLRKCHLCNRDLGDEFHYLLSCKRLTKLRKRYLPTYCHKNPNILKLQSLFSSQNINIQKKLCLFIKNIFSTL